MMDILTTVEKGYIAIFNGYMSQFLQWGKWIFFSLLSFNVIFLSLWYAFDERGFSESMSAFIKRFFIISLFYTIMMHPEWLTQILKTSAVMGETLTHVPIDPSSLISEGIGIANKVMLSIKNANILTQFFSVIILSFVYIVILFVFISIALELALTIVMTTALISMASFFLSFASFIGTRHIARQTLDVILANCVKLLGIYVVIGAGSQSILIVTQAIPTRLGAFDPYVWLIAVVLFFWMLAKNLPNQLARIVSSTMQSLEGTDASSLSMSAITYMKTAQSLFKSSAASKEKASYIEGHSISEHDKATASINQKISPAFHYASSMNKAEEGITMAADTRAYKVMAFKSDMQFFSSKNEEINQKQGK